MAIYENQTALEIRVDTGIDLSTAQSVQIKYIDASKESGIWNAVIETPATDGIISYQIQESDVPLAVGTWKVWSFITFQNDTVAPGSPTIFEVLKEGEIGG